MTGESVQEAGLQITPIVLVTAVTGLALLLRVIALDSQLWLDEMFTLKLIQLHAPGELLTVYGNEHNHVLYSALAGLSVSWFGEHAWSIRLPALLFGVASVPATYLLGTLVASPLEGLLAAMLLTVSYHHVWFSQNARGYTAAAFFTLVATYCLMRGLREQRWVFFVVYAVALALAVYVHLGMAFLVLGHVALWVAYPLARGERPYTRAWRLMALGLALAIVLASLFYTPMMMEVAKKLKVVEAAPGTASLHAPEHNGSSSEEALPLDRRLRRIRRAMEVGFEVLSLGLGARIGLGIAGLVLACGVGSFWGTNPLFLAAFALPGLATLGGSLMTRGEVFPRYFFFLIGFGFIIAARGAMVVGGQISGVLDRSNRAGKQIPWGIATAIALAVGSAFALPRNYRVPKMDFLGASQYVERHRGPDDPVIVTGDPAALGFLGFYQKPWLRVNTLEDLERVRALGRDVWLLFTIPRLSGGSTREVREVVERECSEWHVFEGTVGDGDIRVCRFAAR